MTTEDRKVTIALDFRGMPTKAKLSVAAVVASVAVVSYAEGNLNAHSSDQIRGPKPLWRLLCMNALGAIAFLRWGRKELDG
jgi:hypothetical protein